MTKKIYLFGFSRWKHGFVKAFLKEYSDKNIIFINPIFSTHYKLALKKGLDKNSLVFIWGRKEYKEIESFAKKEDITITRVEDGFIRSVGLGSDLTRPYSLVLDDEGIYFDPTTSSRLETILNTYDFDEKILQEARSLKQKILDTKISKYNTSSHVQLNLPKDKTKILVSGQVEDDASIRFGANGMTNLELLKQVKKENPSANIFLKMGFKLSFSDFKYWIKFNRFAANGIPNPSGVFRSPVSRRLSIEIVCCGSLEFSIYDKIFL